MSMILRFIRSVVFLIMFSLQSRNPSFIFSTFKPKEQNHEKNIATDPDASAHKRNATRTKTIQYLLTRRETDR